MHNVEVQSLKAQADKRLHYINIIVTITFKKL